MKGKYGGLKREKVVWTDTWTDSLDGHFLKFGRTDLGI